MDATEIGTHRPHTPDEPQGGTVRPPLMLDHLPGPDSSPDDLLLAFVDSVSARGLNLYPAQEEAVLEIMSGKHVILSTPTGSGKSLVAVAMHFKALAEGKRSYYTCPIKALVSEKFFALCEDFGAHNVGMMTGDATINRDAPIICCTAEILANLAIAEAERAAVQCVVMDEFHYYSDKDRGMAWQIPLLTLPQATFLLMSATLGDVANIAESLTSLTGRQAATVRSGTRPVPLDFAYRETALHVTLADLLGKGKCPVYVVNFTQREAAEEAQNVLSVDFCSKEEKRRIGEALRGFRFDTPFGKDIRRFVSHGVGLHHAGLLPKYRLLVEKLAQEGLLKVIMGTDTLGVGVNIPIRTVLFTKLCKFDGDKVGILSIRDFKQIAGRAGRKGFDERGSVVCQAPEHIVENKIIDGKADAKGGKKRKQVKKKAPTKNYVHWDANTFQRLIDQPPEVLQSRFGLSHATVLTALQGAEGSRDGYRRIVQTIAKSHESDRRKARHRRHGALLFRSLRQAGIVDVVLNRQTGSRPVINESLQRDFSLNHTLSLYLHDTITLLDANDESYALDVLSLVESILEHPRVILAAQVSKLRTELLAQLKAEGVEYEDRMEELQKVEHPKPNSDFIYATFDEFATKHPWVGHENIRPKSIAREMYERCALFHEYVRDYGLQRSEGILLRYLSQAYKTLVQSVPDTHKNEGVDDVVAYLRSMLGRVDSSLLTEWEKLLEPAELDSTQPDLPARGIARRLSFDPEVNPRAFNARVRAQMHQLVKALALKDYEEAVRVVRHDDDDPWTPERFEEALRGYYEEYGHIDTTPKSRMPHLTVLKQIEARTWQVQQVIVDPEAHNQWVAEGLVVLDDSVTGDDALVTLRRVGI